MSYKHVAEGLSMIPYVVATVVLAVVCIILVVMIYAASYLLIPFGLGVSILSILNGSIAGVLLGIAYAGFGGFCYVEWIEDDLPALTNVAGRMA